MAHTDLANWIESRKENITSDWVEAVRAEPRIQSDADLSDEGLRDHIPAVIAEICDLLRSDQLPAIVNTREARVHAYVRFRQGYRARELVRELSLLRMTLLDRMAERVFEGAEKLSMETYISAARSIDLYIDEEMSYAVSVYAEVMNPSK
jgi:RsbRD-like negative regulator of sigma factor